MKCWKLKDSGSKWHVQKYSSGFLTTQSGDGKGAAVTVGGCCSDLGMGYFLQFSGKKKKAQDFLILIPTAFQGLRCKTHKDIELYPNFVSAPAGQA